MAKGDIREVAYADYNNFGGAAGYGTRISFTTSPTAGDIILLFVGSNTATQTCTGYTTKESRTGSDTNFYLWGRYCTGGDSQDIDITLSVQYANRGGVGYLIEGSFTDLNDVTAYINNGGPSTTLAIPASGQTVAAGTLALAGCLSYGGVPTGFSNSFGTANTNSTNGDYTTVARRAYASGDAGVTTTATYSASQDDMVGILAAVYYGGGAASIVPQAMANYRMRAA
jgi:hypothetical protein